MGMGFSLLCAEVCRRRKQVMLLVVCIQLSFPPPPARVGPHSSLFPLCCFVFIFLFLFPVFSVLFLSIPVTSSELGFLKFLGALQVFPPFSPAIQYCLVCHVDSFLGPFTSCEVFVVCSRFVPITCADVAWLPCVPSFASELELCVVARSLSSLCPFSPFMAHSLLVGYLFLLLGFPSPRQRLHSMSAIP